MVQVIGRPAGHQGRVAVRSISIAGRMLVYSAARSFTSAFLQNISIPSPNAPSCASVRRREKGGLPCARRPKEPLTRKSPPTSSTAPNSVRGRASARLPTALHQDLYAISDVLRVKRRTKTTDDYKRNRVTV